ncbi:MAG: discoidin domain-containing protein, partial [Phycisphaerae bacterium]|nr:discoidin domain-containing protein [Phycisphaerae bacterium]
MRLTWTDTTNNEAGFRIERSTSSRFTRDLVVLTSEANATSCNDTTVAAGTHYYYRISATNPRGESYSSQPADVTTPAVAEDAATLVVISGLPRTVAAGGVYNVLVTMRNTGSSTWTAGGDWRLGSQDPQDNLTWGVGRVQLTGDVATGEEATFLFTVTAPTSLGTYGFQWQMVHELVRWFGDSTPAQDVAVALAPQPPAAPTDLTARAWSSRRIDLSWADNSSGEAALRIERALNADFTDELAMISVQAGQTTYSDTTIEPGVYYYYRVRAIGNEGNSEPTNVVYIDPTDVARNVNATVSASSTYSSSSSYAAANAIDGNSSTRWVSESGVDPQWIRIDLGSAYNISEVKLNWHTYYGKVYKIQFADSPLDAALNDAPNPVVEPNNTSAGWRDHTSLDVTARFVRMRGTVRSSNNYYALYDFQVFGEAVSGSAPAVPADLASTPYSATQTNLSWTSVSGATFYTLDRATDSAFTTDLKTEYLPEATTSYSDTGLTRGTTYYYRLRAGNVNGDSANSDTAVFADIARGRPVDARSVYSSYVATRAVDGDTGSRWLSSSAAGDQWIYVDLGVAYDIKAVSLNWDANHFASNYRIEGLDRPDPTNQLTWDTIVSAEATSSNTTGGWKDLTALADKTYRYIRMRGTSKATGATYYGLYDFQVYGTLPSSPVSAPATPAGLTVTTVSQTQADLSWTNVAAEDFYAIDRATDSAFTTNLNTHYLDADVTSYSDTGLTRGTTYYYRIRAGNGGGDSANSDTAVFADIARNKTTTAHSVYSSNGAYAASNAVDGDNGTRWTSDTIAGDQWVMVDLGQVYNIKAVSLNWYTYYGTNYDIEYSDAPLASGSWTSIHHEPNNTSSGWKDYADLTGSARWVRMNATAHTGSYFGLYDFQVYGNLATQPDVPAAPSDLTAAAVSSTAIDLSWVVTSGEDEKFFKIERATDANFTSNLSSDYAPANATSYSDSGLSAGTTYYYRVRACNAGGDSGNSNTATRATFSDLAVNKTATASHSYSSSYAAGKAVDGDSGTRWQSASGSATEDIYVDLGAAYTIKAVSLNWHSSYYAKTYQIEGSNTAQEGSWASLNAGESNNTSGGVRDFAGIASGVAYRYVRVHATAKATGQNYYALYDFRVYGYVNTAPTLSAISTLPNAVEDSDFSITYDTLRIAANEVEPDGDSLSFRIESVTSGTLTKGGTAVTPGTTLLSSTGDGLVWHPAADANGLALNAFTVKAYDGSLASSTAVQVKVDVDPVNDAPSFAKGSDQTVNEDAGAQTVANWATGLSVGPDNESSQTLSFEVTGNTNSTLFSTAPAVSSDGTLTYTPAGNANGSATITVVAHDDGGTANGGVDTSDPQTFTITVNAVNDAPSFTKGDDQTVNEDAGAQAVANWATGLSVGPDNESSQTLSFEVTGNTNSTLFSTAPAVSSDGT